MSRPAGQAAGTSAKQVAGQWSWPLFARSTLVLRTGRVSGRVTRRAVLVCLLLVLIMLAVAVLSLATGEVAVPPGDVVRYLFGAEGGLDRTVVIEWRLPRVVAAAGFGAALAAAGAIFQTLTRNPLGSPDVIGLSTGAYTGALVVLLLLGSGFGLVTAGALIGGVATAVLVYLLSYRGGTEGFRLIIVGIGVSATLTAFNQWLILRAELDVAISAAVWGAGTLNGIRWQQAGPALVLVLPILVAALIWGPRMRMLDLGDDASTALGLTVERTRFVLLVLGVMLTAVVTAVTGPIAFVALAAPQLARRVTASPGVPVGPAAAMGALLLVTADLIAGQMFAPIQLPVGVVTVSVGGAYLVWLLLKESRA